MSDDQIPDLDEMLKLPAGHRLDLGIHVRIMGGRISPKPDNDGNYKTTYDEGMTWVPIPDYSRNSLFDETLLAKFAAVKVRDEHIITLQARGEKCQGDGTSCPQVAFLRAILKCAKARRAGNL